MNNLFSLEQKPRTGNVDANLLIREYRLDLMARFKEIKSLHTKVKKNEIARKLRFSSSTLQRYRQGKQLQSPL